jgi:hypothetical protein
MDKVAKISITTITFSSHINSIFLFSSIVSNETKLIVKLIQLHQKSFYKSLLYFGSLALTWKLKLKN